MEVGARKEWTSNIMLNYLRDFRQQHEGQWCPGLVGYQMIMLDIMVKLAF